MRTVSLLVALLIGRSAVADPAADACDPAALRAHLARESARAARWNLGWRLFYSAVTIGQAAIAITPIVDRDSRRASAVGAAESALGAGSHWLAPLHVEPPVSDSCSALRDAIERAGRNERKTFWLLHVGILAVNATGAVVLGELTTWQRGALSFVLGYSIGLVEAYTLPRGSWHEARAWTAAAIPRDGGWTVAVGRAF